MRSSYRATKIALLVSVVGVYPLVILADVLDWPVVVQLALGALALTALIGTKVRLTDWDEWRTDRARLRREQVRRRRQTS